MNKCQIVQRALIKQEMSRGELIAAVRMTDRQVDNALTRLMRKGVVGKNGVHPFSTYFSKLPQVIEEGRGTAPASLANLAESSKRGHPEHKKKLRPSILRHPLDIAWVAITSSRIANAD